MAEAENVEIHILLSILNLWDALRQITEDSELSEILYRYEGFSVEAAQYLKAKFGDLA